MCTAATYKTKDFYFGRTLDYEFSYGDEITVTPRKFPFEFRHMGRGILIMRLLAWRMWQVNIRFIMMRSMKRVSVWRDLILLEMQFIRQ